MNNLKELSDSELKEELNKIRPSPIFDAFFIGFLAGIIIFSVAVNTWGFLTIIPLYLIYIFLKKSKRLNALRREMDRRKRE